MIRTITISATAGNAVHYIGSAPGLKTTIRQTFLTLVCNATVANRYLSLTPTITGSATRIGPSLTSAVITASQTKTFAIGAQRQALIGADEDGFDSAVLMDHIPPISYAYGVDVLAIQRWQIKVLSGVAGDSFSGTVTIEEEPL